MELPWENLYLLSQLEQVKVHSYSHPVIIYKHSTRCSISDMAKRVLERFYAPVQNEQYYYLDLIAHRDVSNAIVEIFKVYHESPQLLLIKNGECVYEASHAEINFDELREQILI